MKTDLQEQLFQRYPLIFAERHLSKRESSMTWGIACGDGWFELIDTLCERLQFGTDHNQAPQVVAVQVKEKFGSLSFYIRPGASDEQRGMIDMTTAMSARTCDQCGQPGQAIVNGHWHITRCQEHTPEGAITQAEFIAQRKAPGIAP